MIDLSGITAMIIDTRAPELAAKTLLWQADQCKFDELVLLTDKNGITKDDRIRCHEINTIRNADEYNQSVIIEIAAALRTDHVLLCQCDGYIVNPRAWDVRWKQYDYIGAPWWYYPYNHIPPHPPSTPETCVGNGGFSLRSNKLVSAAANLARSYPKNRWSPEDLFICRTLRHELQSQGLRWAPESVAWKFSCEDTVYNGQFGFHGHQTRTLNPDLPYVVEDCRECGGSPREYCSSCGRGGIAARDIK